MAQSRVAGKNSMSQASFGRARHRLYQGLGSQGSPPGRGTHAGYGTPQQSEDSTDTPRWPSIDVESEQGERARGRAEADPSSTPPGPHLRNLLHQRTDYQEKNGASLVAQW